MPKREETVNGVTINTRHFIATVDVKNQTFTVFGDFCDTEIAKLEDVQARIAGLNDELRDLESMLRRMAGLEGG